MRFIIIAVLFGISSAADDSHDFCVLSSPSACQGQDHITRSMLQSDGPFRDVPRSTYASNCHTSRDDRNKYCMHELDVPLVWQLDSYNTRLNFVDLDNDNDLDIVVNIMNQDNGGRTLNWRDTFPTSLRVLLNVGSRTVPYFKLLSVANSSRFFPPKEMNYESHVWNMPAFGDLDGDGFEDMVMGGSPDKIYFFRNAGNGTFMNISTCMSQGPNWDMWENIQFRMDWYSLDSQTVMIKKYINTQGFFFTPSLVDIDDDNDLDLVVGAQNGKFYYFKNEGNITHAYFVHKSMFSKNDNPFYGLGGNYGNPAWTDLDNDGDLDLSAGEFSGRLNFFENIGSGRHRVFLLLPINSCYIP